MLCKREQRYSRTDDEPKPVQNAEMPQQLSKLLKSRKREVSLQIGNGARGGAQIPKFYLKNNILMRSRKICEQL